MKFRSFSALAPAMIAVIAMFSVAQETLAQVAPQVKFATTAGDFVVEVYPDKAPKTVENFLQYVKDKHYDGTLFHRVIENFMVQGGGFDAQFNQKKTRAPVTHEGREALAKGGPKNVVGTLAMARTNDPHSATAQFFINVKDNAFLDPKRAATRLHRVWQGRQRHGGGSKNQDGTHRRRWSLPVRRSQDPPSYQLCNPGEINYEQAPSRTSHCQLRRHHT